MDRVTEDLLSDFRKPSQETLIEWSSLGISQTTCGCKVEIDGYCEHGNPSWFIILGLV